MFHEPRNHFLIIALKKQFVLEVLKHKVILMKLGLTPILLIYTSHTQILEILIGHLLEQTGRNLYRENI